MEPSYADGLDQLEGRGIHDEADSQAVSLGRKGIENGERSPPQTPTPCSGVVTDSDGVGAGGGLRKPASTFFSRKSRWLRKGGGSSVSSMRDRQGTLSSSTPMVNRRQPKRRSLVFRTLSSGRGNDLSGHPLLLAVGSSPVGTPSDDGVVGRQETGGRTAMGSRYSVWWRKRSTPLRSDTDVFSPLYHRASSPVPAAGSSPVGFGARGSGGRISSSILKPPSRGAARRALVRGLRLPGKAKERFPLAGRAQTAVPGKGGRAPGDRMFHSGVSGIVSPASVSPGGEDGSSPPGMGGPSGLLTVPGAPGRGGAGGGDILGQATGKLSPAGGGAGRGSFVDADDSHVNRGAIGLRRKGGRDGVGMDDSGALSSHVYSASKLGGPDGLRDTRNAPFPYLGRGQNTPFNRYERDWRMTDIAETPAELEEDRGTLLDEAPSSLLLESFTLTVKRIAVWNVLYVDDDLSAFAAPLADGPASEGAVHTPAGEWESSQGNPMTTHGGRAPTPKDGKGGAGPHEVSLPTGKGDGALPPAGAESPRADGGVTKHVAASRTSPDVRPVSSAPDDAAVPHLALPPAGALGMKTSAPQPSLSARQHTLPLHDQPGGPRGADHRPHHSAIRARVTDSHGRLQLPHHLQLHHFPGKSAAGRTHVGGGSPRGGPALSDARPRLLSSHLRSASHSHPAALASAAAAASALAATGHQGFFTLNSSPFHLRHARAREGAHAALTAGAIAAAEAAAGVCRSIHRRRSKIHDHLVALRAGDRRATLGGPQGSAAVQRGDAPTGFGEVDFGGPGPGGNESGRRISQAGVFGGYRGDGALTGLADELPLEFRVAQADVQRSASTLMGMNMLVHELWSDDFVSMTLPSAPFFAYALVTQRVRPLIVPVIARTAAAEEQSFLRRQREHERQELQKKQAHFTQQVALYGQALRSGAHGKRNTAEKGAGDKAALEGGAAAATLAETKRSNLARVRFDPNTQSYTCRLDCSNEADHHRRKSNGDARAGEDHELDDGHGGAGSTKRNGGGRPRALGHHLTVLFRLKDSENCEEDSPDGMPRAANDREGNSLMCKVSVHPTFCSVDPFIARSFTHLLNPSGDLVGVIKRFKSEISQRLREHKQSSPSCSREPRGEGGAETTHHTAGLDPFIHSSPAPARLSAEAAAAAASLPAAGPQGRASPAGQGRGALDRIQSAGGEAALDESGATIPRAAGLPADAAEEPVEREEARQEERAAVDRVDHKLWGKSSRSFRAAAAFTATFLRHLPTNLFLSVSIQSFQVSFPAATAILASAKVPAWMLPFPTRYLTVPAHRIPLRAMPYYHVGCCSALAHTPTVCVDLIATFSCDNFAENSSAKTRTAHYPLAPNAQEEYSGGTFSPAGGGGMDPYFYGSESVQFGASPQRGQAHGHAHGAFVNQAGVFVEQQQPAGGNMLGTWQQGTQFYGDGHIGVNEGLATYPGGVQQIGSGGYGDRSSATGGPFFKRNSLGKSGNGAWNPSRSPVALRQSPSLYEGSGEGAFGYQLVLPVTSKEGGGHVIDGTSRCPSSDGGSDTDNGWGGRMTLGLPVLRIQLLDQARMHDPSLPDASAAIAMARVDVVANPDPAAEGQSSVQTEKEPNLDRGAAGLSPFSSPGVQRDREADGWSADQQDSFMEREVSRRPAILDILVDKVSVCVIPGEENESSSDPAPPGFLYSSVELTVANLTIFMEDGSHLLRNTSSVRRLFAIPSGGSPGQGAGQAGAAGIPGAGWWWQPYSHAGGGRSGFSTGGRWGTPPSSGKRNVMRLGLPPVRAGPVEDKFLKLTVQGSPDAVQATAQVAMMRVEAQIHLLVALVGWGLLFVDFLKQQRTAEVMYPGIDFSCCFSTAICPLGGGVKKLLAHKQAAMEATTAVTLESDDHVSSPSSVGQGWDNDGTRSRLHSGTFSDSSEFFGNLEEFEGCSTYSGSGLEARGRSGTVDRREDWHLGDDRDSLFGEGGDVPEKLGLLARRRQQEQELQLLRMLKQRRGLALVKIMFPSFVLPLDCSHVVDLDIPLLLPPLLPQEPLERRLMELQAEGSRNGGRSDGEVDGTPQQDHADEQEIRTDDDEAAGSPPSAVKTLRRMNTSGLLEYHKGILTKLRARLPGGAKVRFQFKDRACLRQACLPAGA